MLKLDPYLESVVKYYDETRLDYRVLWLNSENRSVHFGYYDETIAKHSDALKKLNHVMAEKVHIGKDDIVLDAGCGQGGSSMWIHDNTGATVEGITLVPHQVDIAKKAAAKRNAVKTNFSLANYCKTHFPDNHFTVVWACESLCHAQEKAEFYQEAMRVLKPGGRLIVAEYIRKDRPLNQEGEEMLHNWLSKWSIKDIDSWEEHRAKMTKAGFENIDMRDCSKNMMPSLRHLHSMSRKLLPLGKFLLKFGLRNQINHGNHVGSVNQYNAFEKGYWFYGIFSAIKPL